MSTAARRGRARVGRVAHLLVAVAIVVVLVLMPPSLPRFGPSLTTPLTTSTLSRLVALLAWIVLLVLALALLQRALAPGRALRPPLWASRPLKRRPRMRSELRRPSAPPVRLLVARPTIATAEPPPLAAAEQRVRDQPDETGDDPIATVALLGPVAIEGVRRPRRAPTVELLAYLALHPDGASRDEVLEAMWPEQDPRRTRPRLWQSVSEARRLLGDAFEREGDRYRLDRARVANDVDELRRLLERLAAARPADALPLVERALALWRGAPLAGADYAWVDGFKSQLEGTLTDLAERAARARLEAGDARGSLEIAERALAIDSLNETFVRLALQAEGALGQRERVTERYEAFREHLDATLGLEPERETRMCYRALLGQEQEIATAKSQLQS